MRKITVLMLAVLCFSLMNFAAIPSSERTALKALYNALGGDEWTQKEGWKTAPLDSDGFGMSGTEGTWTGVTVSSNHVTDLYLPYNKLEGAIPSEIGNLVYLTGINFNYNSVNGSLPSQIGNLTKLINLNLLSNKISGSLPSQMGKLTNLRILMLNFNKLSGSIPSDLGLMTSLQGLYLSDNQLTGAIPSSLGNLKSLKSINFSNNALTGGIPSQLGSLSKLVILNFSNNNLSGSIPSTLGSLTNLVELRVGNNGLSGKLPSQLSNLTKLYYLTLNNNQFYGEIPSGYKNLKNVAGLDIGNNCLRASDSAVRTWLASRDPDWESNQTNCGTPEITLDRSQLNFGSNAVGIATSPQTVLIDNTGSGDLSWTATSNATWLLVSPSTGSNTGNISISVNASGLQVGTYSGTITVSAPDAPNSPQTISVNLQVYGSQGSSLPPFGEFSTPVEGVTVNNSIPVTGWVLDDIGVSSVKIYNDETYVGDAIFVEGARPDVQAVFPNYPNNYKAGWGYMLLSRFLPNGGNGVYNLVAKATDLEGNEFVLGSKSITIDNENAKDPFGAIDTPTQGGLASGTAFINWGWVLTPQPASIATNGSTIYVFVDGVNIGHPKYNVYRPDIATYFPGYANSNGASGYFSMDTTSYTNGIHTIAWTVSDSAGRTSGVGSRFFSILNTDSSESSNNSQIAQSKKNSSVNGLISLVDIPTDSSPVSFYTGFDKSSTPCWVGTGENEADIIIIKELDRIEVDLKGNDTTLTHFSGYMKVGNGYESLPAGITLDSKNGILYWQPAPGFIGEYGFLFVGTDEDGRQIKKHVRVRIEPLGN